MKANRKFLNGDDEAVSPVIAVILMVAITVVLAATVYVWVSGFGANGSQPAKSIAFSSGAALVTAADLDGTTADDSYKLYVVSAASPGLKYSDLAFTLNGASATRQGDCSAILTDLATDGTDAPFWISCSGAFSASATTKAADALVSAGDHVYLSLEGASMSGQSFRVLDSAANSIVTTLTVS
jgi:flagellin-like protein